MSQGYAGRSRNPYLLGAIIGAHVAALTAVMLAKTSVFREPPTGIIIRNIPLDPPPPVKPPPPDRKEKVQEPQSPSVMTVVEPKVIVPSLGPVVAPSPPDEVVFTPTPGPSVILPQPGPLVRDDPPARVEPEPIPTPRPRPVKLKPRGNPGSWVTNADYPAAALSAEEQGMTGIALEVGADGRPTACDVTASSGSRALDDAACRLLMKRARFEPGRDGDGAAVGGRWTNSFRWRIPED